MTDSILYFGTYDEKLPKLLAKLGYGVLTHDGKTGLGDFIAQNNLDVILVDSRFSENAEDLCTFLRTQEGSRALPIVYIAPEPGFQVAEDLIALERVEVLHPPVSIGGIAGRIATELRLRKFDGKDELKATLAEVNATLRDYNERFKRELDEARTIQRGLLPEALPKDPRVQMAVSYEPLEEVGGDWYFCEKTVDGKLMLQIADVTGHGLGAAFVGSMAKLAMAAVNKQRPDELLTGLNRLMAPQIPPGRFVTMGSALYDPETGALQWARAGHPPALIVRSSTKEVVQLMGDGFAIGFFEDSEYSMIEDRLEPGDLLLMYTDGISEAQNRSLKTYGLERLSQVLIKAIELPSTGDVLSAVMDDVDLFRGERMINDDVTAIVIRRLK